MPVWLHAELNVQHSGQRRHVAVLAAAGGLSPTIPFLSPRRSSNLTCPSFLHPPFRPRLPTQWTVPTTGCCQCTHTWHKNTKQRGRAFVGASTQQIRLSSPAWNVCQLHSFTYIVMLLLQRPSRCWQNDSAATSPWSYDGSEYRVTQQPANHSMHKPLKCAHYRAFAFQWRSSENTVTQKSFAVLLCLPVDSLWLKTELLSGEKHYANYSKTFINMVSSSRMIKEIMRVIHYHREKYVVQRICSCNRMCRFKGPLCLTQRNPEREMKLSARKTKWTSTF